MSDLSLRSYCEQSGKDYLLLQWDTERNLPLTPDTVGHASGRLVWWRCDKGHAWQTQVHSRAAGTTGCPRCSEARMAEKRRRRQAEREQARLTRTGTRSEGERL